MSGNAIRFGITTVFVLILVSSILVVRAHFGASVTAESAAAVIEPFLLLVLGSILLSIGAVIKMLLTRKLKQR